MTQATSNVTVAKQRDGKWSFTLTFRGVTHPASGKFSSQLQAQAAGMATLNALQGHRQA
ncbi:hypothetical protein C8J35_101555 [Rhizobium sp. PP-F2F-G38]|uniref:hypothetical protein n=1 Tax=Rhizobium sp. PP-CC-3G-465 TaxID=2135648 RepID=UPI000D9C74B0|nr:hypothetical protein C8J37_101556 [Rhizobium sp. PP-WC-1G-195]PYF00738.1 hypothetical protein C8J35_101555 [Rhizobium sp. PP-F2F-G38]TCP90577.1 hypothetical protein C8J31_101420 [Rhizobium sp. PP-CC-2G-626]TCQ27938.1 hypothetical protein C8J33_101570 [Rhizobium sp. PP-CC-3G-465]